MGVLYARSGGAWVPISSAPLASNEILYSEITASITVTATSAAGSQTVINPGSVTYDGTPVVIEFSSPLLVTPIGNGGQILIQLFDVNTDLGYFAQLLNSTTGNNGVPVQARRRLTPSAGAHNYNVRAWVAGGDVSGTVRAGAGGAGVHVPAFLRITRA